MYPTHKTLLLCAVTAMGFPLFAHAGAVIITNTSFETQGSGTDDKARNWNFNDPDSHGGYWGSFARRPWRAHAGSWEGALQGKWSGNDFGGVWQEGGVTPGQILEASAWFWADVPGTGSGGAFTTAVQELKIEFYSSGFGDPIQTVQTNLTGIVENWTQKFLRATVPAGASWARWVCDISGASSFGALQFDEASLRVVESGSENFNDWTGFDNDSNCVRFGWIVSTGRIQTANARSGKCANLGNPGTVATNGHYIQSPSLTNGIGTIRFYYASETTNVPMTYDIQISPNATNWITVAGITNIVNTNYLKFSKFLYEPTQHYARIYHTAGTNRLLVDDILVSDASPLQRYVDFDDWALSSSNTSTIFGGWELTTGTIVSVNADAVQAAQILGGTNTVGGNYLLSPLFADGVGEVTFVYRAYTNTSPLSFSVQYSVDSTNWVTMGTYSGVSNMTYQDADVYIYAPSGGYARILHTGGTSTNSLLVDELEVATPAFYRSQNFDTWPNAGSRFSTYDYQGWHAVAAEIDTNRAIDGQSARLIDTVGSNALIRSPYFADGVGTISFQYSGDGPISGPANVNYRIETSTDNTTWVSFDSNSLLGVTNFFYTNYSRYCFITNGSYVRIIHTSGGRRVAFDDISVDIPRPPADVAISGYTSPQNPFTNDSVTLLANLQPLYGAVNVSITSYYRLGTSGAFTALGMGFTNQTTYYSTSAVPPQLASTIVQYYMKCDFTGPAASSNSPKYFPSGGSNGPAFYGVPRNRPGSIWVNELNFVPYFFDDDTNEFIEIAGPAGSDLTGWRINLAYGNYVGSVPTYANYTIGAFVISNDFHGYGFYVLGDVQILVGVDMLFTNTASGSPLDNMYDGPVGAIEILNEVGGVEYRMSYNGPVDTYQYIYASKNNFDPGQSLSLTGTGTNFASFTWTTNIMTPGGVNFGQDFLPTNGPPNVYFYQMIIGTNIWIYTYGNTNSWNVQPLYATNLAASPQTWLPVTPYNSTTIGGTNVIWFDRPTTITSAVYQVLFTSP